jgi:hypothetical protein
MEIQAMVEAVHIADSTEPKSRLNKPFDKTIRNNYSNQPKSGDIKPTGRE